MTDAEIEILVDEHNQCEERPLAPIFWMSSDYILALSSRPDMSKFDLWRFVELVRESQLSSNG